ncbi:hypothetical protein [Paenibacillus graminis]|uniref:Uncharacterized protein n=1 Tax=Paenibacillus graminis TaxID=189425 RepID=A0A089M1L4_9BACL|nr:hypothetical protein [Paenibacillus graminis]AIQ66290.1 hypothetical protein PGRAT_00425 [Paenibacillus graminis]
MNTNTGGKQHKRGQRKNNLVIPQRFPDRLSPSVLETSRVPAVLGIGVQRPGQLCTESGCNSSEKRDFPK